MKTIVVSLDNIGKAVKEIEAYEAWVKERTAVLVERLSIIGAAEASVRFAAAMYDGVNDSQITVEPIANGYKIVASGEAVAFIEFGAGVYHNPAEPYPLKRPAGIVGIGKFGKGHGKRRMWGYYDESGQLVRTRGNPASLPLWYASESMRREIESIAREVFA